MRSSLFVTIRKYIFKLYLNICSEVSVHHTYTAENFRHRTLFKESDNDPNITFLQRSEAKVSIVL